VSKWPGIDRDNLHIKFSALNVDFSNASPNPLDLRRPAHASVKERYHLRSGYFTVIGWSSVKRLQIGTDTLLIIISTGNELLRNVNIHDLK